MTNEEIIRDIRKRCRLAMNGVVSSSMREHGFNYKLNFGVSLGKIKEIANCYQPDKSFAENLWKEDVRELKILATMLFPVNETDEETLERWINEIPNQEIREQLCMNLLQKVDFAPAKAMEWANNLSETKRITGYWLLSRLLIIRKLSEFDFNSLQWILADVKSNNILLRNAAISTLKYIGRISGDYARDILNSLVEFKDSENLPEKEIYDSLRFEFEFYSGN